MKLIEFIQLDNLDVSLSEITHYRTIPAYQRAKELFTDLPRKQHYDAMAKFHDFITQHGFKRLGEGSFGAVYEKPGYPWVFKIFNNDPAYLAWIEFALKNQNNPHVPKFKGRPFKITDKAFAIRMEKLEHSDTAIESVRNLLKRWNGTTLTGHQAQYLDDVGIPDMTPILNGIAAISVRQNLSVDIHEYNVMSRGGEPVIVDPLVDDNLLRAAWAGSK